MGIFKTLKQKLFGSSTPVFRPFRQQKEADIEAGAQAQRRRKQLERRVKSGESTEVYPNRKKISSEAKLPGTWGNESPLIQAFLDGYPLSQFASSNVWALQYDRTRDTLYMQFMGGSGKKKSGPGQWYAYKNVNVAEAKIAYNTASKGIYNWSHLRRGKKLFQKVSAPPSYLPLGRKKGNVLQQP